MKSKAKRPAYSYLRFSDHHQGSGFSTRRQSEPPEKICREQGWVLQTRTYRDCGVSAFRGKNRDKGDLSLFLAALKAGHLEPNPVLILEDLDRLSRTKPLSSVDVAREILEGGCDLYSVIERKLYTRASHDDPMGLLGLIWRFHLAHEESAKKADRERKRWADNHRLAREEKAVFSRMCPAWLRVVDRKKVKGRPTGGRFEPIPERVKVVNQIFKWCIEGNGVHVIVKKLLAENIPPFKSGWGQKYVFDMLRDRKVLGDLPTRTYGEKIGKAELIEGYYPCVLDDPDDFDKAQDAMQVRKLRSGRKGEFVNLFSGLVRYAPHGCSMVLLSKPTSRNGRAFMYRYLASYLGFKGEKPYVAVKYDRFENVVLRWLYELKSADLMPTEKDEGVESLKARRKLLEKRIKEVADQLEKIDTSVPAVMQKLAEMEAKKTKLNEAIEEKQRLNTRPMFDDTKALIDMMKGKANGELRELREQLRQRLLLHIERIDVRVDEDKAFLTIRMQAGLERRVYFNLKTDEDGLWTPVGKRVNVADLERLSAEHNLNLDIDALKKLSFADLEKLYEKKSGEKLK